MKRIVKILICVTFSVFILSGCDRIDDLQVKMGMKNSDFNYIKQGKVNKIVIQSTRDKGFTFIVEDKNAIQDIYEILSSAKYAKKKSTLTPDYIFEMYENDESIHKFQYIVGLDKKSGGNFYDENNMYIVSKRIDNDIIQNFWNISEPKKFDEIYYGSILQVLEKYKGQNNVSKKIGINIYNDVDMNKFLLSTDLENFKSDLKKNKIDADIIDKNINDYEIVTNIVTEGFTPTVYKCSIVIYDKQKNTEKKYYVKGNYDNTWKIEIYEDEIPQDW